MTTETESMKRFMEIDDAYLQKKCHSAVVDIRVWQSGGLGAEHRRQN